MRRFKLAGPVLALEGLHRVKSFFDRPLHFLLQGFIMALFLIVPGKRHHDLTHSFQQTKQNHMRKYLFVIGLPFIIAFWVVSFVMGATEEFPVAPPPITIMLRGSRCARACSNISARFVGILLPASLRSASGPAASQPVNHGSAEPVQHHRFRFAPQHKFGRRGIYAFKKSSAPE